MILNPFLRKLVPVKVRRSVAHRSNELFMWLYGRMPEAARVFISDHASIVRTMDYPGAPIVLSIRSEAEYRTRTRSCAKEPETVAWIETELRPGDVFYDIGANVGAYSLVAAKAHGGNVRVFAFEPSFANYSQLCTNLSLNHSSDVVSPLPVALSDNTRLLPFHYNSLQTGSAFNTLENASVMTSASLLHHDALCVRLDDFVAWFGIPPPTHLKIDVDGLELDVLRGSGKLLDTSIRSILVEVHFPEGEAQIVDYLTARGFELAARHQRYSSDYFNLILTRVANSKT